MIPSCLIAVFSGFYLATGMYEVALIFFVIALLASRLYAQSVRSGYPRGMV